MHSERTHFLKHCLRLWLLLSAFSVPYQICATEAQSAAGQLISFEKNEMWGYKDLAGKVVLPAKYIMANDFSPKGIAAVLDETGWAIINTRGQVLLRPFIFDNGPDYFSEGLARFVGKEKIGFFNENGQVVIAAQFDFAEPFKDGVARICFGCKKSMAGEHYTVVGGEWSVIDKKGTFQPTQAKLEKHVHKAKKGKKSAEKIASSLCMSVEDESQDDDKDWMRCDGKPVQLTGHSPRMIMQHPRLAPSMVPPGLPKIYQRYTNVGESQIILLTRTRVKCDGLMKVEGVLNHISLGGKARTKESYTGWSVDVSHIECL